MTFDLRLPIGLMFLLIGLLLVGYGLTADPAIFARTSLGINVDLDWGAALAVFGAIMLALAKSKGSPDQR